MSTNSINTNISALYAQNNLRMSGMKAQHAIAALSSGNKIINASDDVAGLAVGTVLRTSVSTLKTALSNTKQASTLLNIADGGLANVTEILNRQATLAVSAKSGTLSDTERAYLDQEFQALADEIDRLAENTKFNQVKLLNGDIYNKSSVTVDTRTGDTDNDTTLPSSDADDALGIDRVAYTTAGATFGDSFVGDIAVVANVGGAGTNTNGNTAAAGGIGIFNNDSFFGTLSGWEVNYIANNNVQVQITIGDITYTGNITDTTAAGTFTFIGVSEITGLADGGSFDLVVAGTTTTDAVLNQTDAEELAVRLDSAFGTVTFYNQLDVNSFNGAAVGNIYVPNDTTVYGNLNDMTLEIRHEDFSSLEVESVSVSEAVGGGADGTIEIVVNGETYRSATGIGESLAGAATAVLTSVENQQHRIIITNGATALDFSTQERAQAVQDALESAFGLNQGASALKFQVGLAAEEVIDVAINSADTERLYDGKDLDLLSVANAEEALGQVNAALDEVTKLRADVGAVQSRFNFAAANLETSIQNQDAARAAYLDADISEESTKFANAQVLMQASISVLAQANLMPQNLLKLIG